MEKYRQAEKCVEENLVLIRSDDEPMNTRDWDTFSYKKGRTHQGNSSQWEQLGDG